MNRQPQRWTIDHRIADILESDFGYELLKFITYFSKKSVKDLDKFYIRSLPLRSYPIISRLSGVEFDNRLIAWLIEKLNQEKFFQNPLPVNKHFEKRWWKDAVIYHIFVPSFSDSDQDGIGDLRGIINNFEYLLSLNVNALLLSPIFDTPFYDTGYDVKNYQEIYEKFGDKKDLAELITLCHHHKIKVILTFPMNQTSDEHQWFLEETKPSFRSNGNSEFQSNKASQNYYIARNIPNNWQSLYGDSAWLYERNTKKYYLHLKSQKQIELNWHNPKLRAKMIEGMKYWKTFGIDGIFMESSSFIAKNKSFRDGNKIIGNLTGISGLEQYTFQPELLLWLNEIYRELKTDDPDFLLISDNQKVNHFLLQFLSGDATQRSDLGLSYAQYDHPQMEDMLAHKISLQHLNETWVKMQNAANHSYWPVLFCEDPNHPRIVSLVSNDASYRATIAKLIATMLLTAKGTVLLYQGQELGQINAPFHHIEQIRDRATLSRYEKINESPIVFDNSSKVERILNSSKDHARVPIAFDETINNGFSQSETTWIDCFSDSGMTINEQTNDSHSVLNYYRALISLRLHFSTFIKGKSYALSKKNKNIMRTLRFDQQHAFYIEINLTDENLNVEGISTKQLEKIHEAENLDYEFPRRIDNTILLSNYPDRNQQEIRKNIDLRPYEAFIAKLY